MFANAEQAVAASWIAVALSALTMLGGVATLLVNKWSDRAQVHDKLANETEKVELRAKVSILEERQARCLEGHAEVTEKLKRCEEDHHKSSEDRSRIWQELNAIKSETASRSGAAAG